MPKDNRRWSKGAKPFHNILTGATACPLKLEIFAVFYRLVDINYIE